MSTPVWAAFPHHLSGVSQSGEGSSLSNFIAETIEHLVEMRDWMATKEVGSHFGNDVNSAIDLPSFNNGSSTSFAKAIDLCRVRIDVGHDAGVISKIAGILVQDLEYKFRNPIEEAGEAIYEVEEKKRQLARARGLSSLPEEVLRLIFAKTRDLDLNRSWIVPFNLSAVCRRFRNIVLSSPNLWSSIATVVRSEEALNTLLERSCQAGLNIKIHNERRCTLNNFCSAIKPHSQRWTSLLMSFQGGSEIDIIFSLLQPNALPRLTNVAVSTILSSAQLIKLAQYWKNLAPNINTLDVGVYTPSQYVLPASLRRLTLRIRKHTESAVGSTRDLVALLLSAPALEDVSLYIDSSSPEEFDGYRDGGKRVVTMPNVANLNLEMVALRGLKPLLRDLYFPNLRGLSIALEEKFRFRGDRIGRGNWGGGRNVDFYGPGEDVGAGLELMDELLLCSKTYNMLTTLSLKLCFPEEAKLHDYGTGTLENIFLKYAVGCPSLKHLTLETTIFIKYMNLPSLLALTLTRCNLQSTKFLKDCEHGIKDRIEINQCGLVEGRWDDVNFEEESKLILLGPERGRRK